MKRILDFIGSVLGLIIIVPFTPFIALAIILEDGLPIFVKLDRISQGKIIKVSANAVAYPDNGQAATTITIDVLKAVIADTDVSVLSSALAIEGGTANTAIHGTLSTTSGALDFLEGQLIYAQADVSNNSITPRSDGLVVTVEWYPTER